MIMTVFAYLCGMIYSFIASLRVPTVVLWTLVILATGNSLMETDQGWGVYHYYVGAKYFTEVGYFDLYECTVQYGDMPLDTPRRDLSTYDYRTDDARCSSEFSYPRAIQFHHDIQASGFYEQALIDKGYNGTPVWTAIFGTLANWNIITPDNAHVIDIVALVSALFFCVYHLGWRKSAYIAIIILTYHGTMLRVWGHYAQWVWLATAIMGVVLLEKRNGFGAILLGISTSLAIFPVVLMLRYAKAKYLILFAVALMGMGTIGLANGRGLDGYFEFVDNMSLHSSYVRTEGCCDIGLAHTIAFTLNPTDDYVQCFVEWHDECSHRYEKRFEPLLWLVTLPFVIATPLGAMYGLLTLSTYYYLILAIIPIWYSEKWTRGLLFLHVVFPASTIFISWSLLPYRHWLYFLYFVALGVHQLYVSQTLQTAVVLIQQRLHPAIATRHVSQ